MGNVPIKIITELIITISERLMKKITEANVDNDIKSNKNNNTL